MSDRFDSKLLDAPEFQSLLVACLESLQHGEAIDRDALTQDYPEFAAEIAQFLDDRQLLEQMASQFAKVEPSRVTIAAYEQTMDANAHSRDYVRGDQIRYIGEYEGRHYFTMDYVDGQSLADVIREAPLPPLRAAEVVRIAAEAVHFAHQQGTVHRDLKPANVLLDKAEQPHITDFGLAKVLERLDHSSPAELTTSGQIWELPATCLPSRRQESRL